MVGALIIRWRVGYDIVDYVSSKSITFMEFSFAGASRVFGNPWFYLHPYPMTVLHTHTLTHYSERNEINIINCTYS